MTFPIERLLDAVEFVPIETDGKSEPVGGLPVATHQGYLDFLGQKLRVYKLSNGLRVVDAQDFHAFLADGFGNSLSDDQSA